MRVHMLTAFAVAVPVGVITVFLVGIVLRARRNKVVTGTQGLIGEIGTAQSPLRPQGKIFVHGELWDAVSSSDVQPGEQVRVTAVDGFVLRVEPVTVSTRQPATV
jgi:membrane-bound serine protease (ClpP class)